ncbi:MULTISPECIES: hypothetical protein [unclassified Bradyrhizobium]|uniref:hypothetical protein n=1 Tax=unclassified Bradyrhizobium TaxID=2631580 RepID=UPI002916291B|nr:MULTISPECIES: hypothetical protein [unclassified Bradyrhizobium]
MAGLFWTAGVLGALFIFIRWDGATPWRAELLFTAILTLATIASVLVASMQWWVLKDTLQQSRDALVIQQRAFMTAKEVRFEPLSLFGVEGITWLANVYWENSGNTPTKNLTIVATCVSGFEQLVDPANIPKAKKNTTFQSTTITRAVFGPKQINHAGFCPVTRLEVLLAQYGAFTHLYIYGVAIYHDVFDQSSWRLTRFCFQAGNFVVNGADNDPTMTALVVPCVVRNCTDEECGEEVQSRVAEFMARKIKLYRPFRSKLAAQPNSQAP